MTDDELVERLAAGLYQCHGHSTLVRDGSGSDWVCDGDSHSPDCPVTEKPAAMALAREVAAAVREVVLKEKAAEIDRLIELLLHIATCGNGLNRECDRCGTLNSDLTKAAISLRAKRGVTESET